MRTEISTVRFSWFRFFSDLRTLLEPLRQNGTTIPQQSVGENEQFGVVEQVTAK